MCSATAYVGAAPTSPPVLSCVMAVRRAQRVLWMGSCDRERPSCLVPVSLTESADLRQGCRRRFGWRRSRRARGQAQRQQARTQPWSATLGRCPATSRFELPPPAMPRGCTPETLNAEAVLRSRRVSEVPRRSRRWWLQRSRVSGGHTQCPSYREPPRPSCRSARECSPVECSPVLVPKPHVCPAVCHAKDVRLVTRPSARSRGLRR